MIKESIAVYNPSDKLESALQKSFHKYNDGWLTSYECRLAAKAVANLKINSEWLSEEDLFDIRADHIFAPEMIGNEQQLAFPTHLFFLRDIIENRKISSIVNYPITFVSKAIGLYLLPEYPIHMIVDLSAIDSTEAISIGGLHIFDNNVDLPRGSIKGFNIQDKINKNSIQQSIDLIVRESNMRMNKAATTNLGKGVFGLERGIDLNVKANDRVQNKVTKKRGIVYAMEPGDSGFISVLFDNGQDERMNKNEFVETFIYGLGKET